MNTIRGSNALRASLMIAASLLIAPSRALAQTPDTTWHVPMTAPAEPAAPASATPQSAIPDHTTSGLAAPQAFAAGEQVIQYDLSGPRIGATFAPDGTATSQFGWHFEHQAAPGTHGPWFIVERIFLVSGLEANRFMPSGTVVFGLRMPSSFEFGVGPSVTLGGQHGFGTAIVVAAGQSFRAGGIRVPVNAAVAINRYGENRYSIMTGWAIKDSFASH